MHAESDQSIIVEILERVNEVSDENAIKYEDWFLLFFSYVIFENLDIILMH